MQPLPIRDRGYVHPELLAETDRLADRLTDRILGVIDAQPPYPHRLAARLASRLNGGRRT